MTERDMQKRLGRLGLCASSGTTDMGSVAYAEVWVAEQPDLRSCEQEPIVGYTPYYGYKALLAARARLAGVVAICEYVFDKGVEQGRKEKP